MGREFKTCFAAFAIRCFVMATRAQRLGPITIANGSGQYALWVAGTCSIVAADFGGLAAGAVGAGLVVAWSLLLIGAWRLKRRGMVLAATAGKAAARPEQ